ncbi:MAG: hypothetical protein A2Z20_01865 [Bdellovibrionales bacterium RBG_16_40_8]|nr:MAG: hypothetical protein A2Z20_01865 [Bdellovibrionales bacterium RBG_16_40_8]
MLALGSSEEKVYYQKDHYFSDLLESIKAANQSVEFETYIFENDELGQKVIQALIMAAARGASVQVTVDGVGSLYWIGNLIALFQESRVKFQVYHPFLFYHFTSWRLLRLDRMVRAFSQLNKRLHRKICLIDNTTAFVGSFNVTNKENRDTGVMIRGEDSLALLRHNKTRKLRLMYNNDLAIRLRSAQKRIWITNAYFVPPVFILKALYVSARKEVDVRLLLPARSDRAFMKWITETYYSGLLQSGIRIFEYEKKFLHAKTLMIDDWALVGSSNMDHRSLFHDLEVDAVLRQQASRQSLAKQFDFDLKNSTEIFVSDLNKRCRVNVIVGWLLQIFRYWV